VSHRNSDYFSQDNVDVRIASFAAGRHGVVSYAEAVRLGLTKRIVERRVAARRWERLYRGVYRLNGVPGSWHQMLLAACLAMGDGAAASHRAAAALWRLAGFEPGAIEICVPRGRRPNPRGTIVHQLELLAIDVTIVEAIPTTTPARTLIDLAAVAPADLVEEALDDALRRGLVTLPRLRWRLGELGPRRGARTIRRLLDARANDDRRPQSVLETRLMRLFQRAGLPTPACQHEIRHRGRLIAVVDFAYPGQLLAIEADGYRWHSGRARWQRDLARRNELTRLGWHVIHVTAEDLHRRPEVVVATVASALRRF
jgi:very-short-patch-repair endonuclease